MADVHAGKTTLEDLAKLAGVSVSTVSRELNDHPLISTRTKQRIWALTQDHDYAFRQSMPTTCWAERGRPRISLASAAAGSPSSAAPIPKPCSAAAAIRRR